MSAGIDVMGDGTLVAYEGGVRRASSTPARTGRSKRCEGAQVSDAGDIPKGSYAAGRRAKLPRGASEPIRVHINGVEQPRGEVWDVREGAIVFTRPIVKESVSTGRWLAMYLGLFGSYKKTSRSTSSTRSTARRSSPPTSRSRTSRDHAPGFDRARVARADPGGPKLVLGRRRAARGDEADHRRAVLGQVGRPVEVETRRTRPDSRQGA